ncbi:L-fuculose-phosphate aldolase [Vibrio mediterranei]
MNRELLAQQVIDTCLEMNSLGLNQGTSGNVSVRYQDGMLITPSGISYLKLTPNKIVYVDGQGRAEAGKVPSSEWHFHLACLAARPELNAVIHTHAVHCTAVSILNRSIPALHYMVAVTGIDHVPCVPYSTFGSQALADSVSSGIRESKALLMQHHGMIAMESNLEKALWLANEVEVLANLYLKVSAVQQDVPTLSAQEMQTVIGKFKTYGLKSD